MRWVIADAKGIVGDAPALCLAFGQVRREHGLAPPFTKQRLRAGDYSVRTADGRVLYMIREDVADGYVAAVGWPLPDGAG